MNNKKSITASILGTIIESYDLLLYIHLLPILTPLFFPEAHFFSSRIIAAMTVSATLVMRPLGAIFFGYKGDTKGRRTGLSSALILMMIPTLFLGVLPDFGSIGLWAPFFLIVCRLLQGFSMGGESGGAQVCLVEFSTSRHLCIIASFCFISIIIGGLLATVAALLVNIDLLHWRATFLFGAVLSSVGFFVRYRMLESQQFIECSQNNNIISSPLRALVAQNAGDLFKGFCMSFGAVVPFHLNYVYMVDFLKNTLLLSIQEIVLLNIVTQVTSVFLMLLFGYLSDKYKKEVFMLLSLLIFSIIVYPLILFNNVRPSFLNSVVIQFSLCLCCALYAGGFFSSVALLFPVNRRFTGASFTVSLGVAVFSFVSSLFIWASSQGSFILYTLPVVLMLVILNLFSIYPRVFLGPSRDTHFRDHQRQTS